jgi:hypothetical protein
LLGTREHLGQFGIERIPEMLQSVTISPIVVGFAAAFACISLGGGLYEFSVVDPFWPRRPDLIQPQRGGISRKRFWIPAHTAFELLLIVSLVLTWSTPDVRWWLVAGLATHAVMRIWSVVDFIPKALAFERADPAAISEETARRWSRRSLLRFPLDVGTCAAKLLAFAHAVP